jgi:hypothetical protein
MQVATRNVCQQEHFDYIQHTIDGDIDKTASKAVSKKGKLSRNCISTLHGMFACILIDGLTFIIQHQLKNAKLHLSLILDPNYIEA